MDITYIIFLLLISRFSSVNTQDPNTCETNDDCEGNSTCQGGICVCGRDDEGIPCYDPCGGECEDDSSCLHGGLCVCDSTNKEIWRTCIDTCETNDDCEGNSTCEGSICVCGPGDEGIPCFEPCGGCEDGTSCLHGILCVCNSTNTDIGRTCIDTCETNDDCEGNSTCEGGICVCGPDDEGIPCLAACEDFGQLPLSQCDQNAQCVLLHELYPIKRCVCNPGFIGNGITCPAIPTEPPTTTPPGLLVARGPHFIQNTAVKQIFSGETITIEGDADGDGKYRFCVRGEAIAEDIDNANNVGLWVKVEEIHVNNPNVESEMKPGPLWQRRYRKYLDAGVIKLARVIERVFQFEIDLASGDEKVILFTFTVNPRVARQIVASFNVFRDDDGTGNACLHLSDAPPSADTKQSSDHQPLGNAEDASFDAIRREKLVYTDTLIFNATEFSGYTSGDLPSVPYTFCAGTKFYAKGLERNGNIQRSANANQYDDAGTSLRLERPSILRSSYLQAQQDSFVRVFEDSMTFTTDTTATTMKEIEVNFMRVKKDEVIDATLHLLKYSLREVTIENPYPCVPYTDAFEPFIGGPI